MINGVFWFCSLEILFSRPQFVRSNLCCKLTSWQPAVIPHTAGWICTRLTSLNKKVVNISSDCCLLKNDTRRSPWMCFVTRRLFSLCWSVLLGAWWRSPHRSKGMGSCGADALCGSHWLRSRLVYFHFSEGKLCSQDLSSQHSLPLWLYPKKKPNEVGLYLSKRLM